MIATIRRAIDRPVSGGVFPGDIQGNILLGYNHPVGAALFLNFPSASAARALLYEVLAQVTSAAEWEQKPPSTLNISFTYAGLVTMGLPAVVLDSFPAAFREGMAARAALLGDLGASAPEHWDIGLGTGEAHALFDVQAAGPLELDDAVEKLSARCRTHSVHIISVQTSCRLPDRKEHFGYTDGVGQPAMQGTSDPRRGVGQMDVFHNWLGLPIGEIFHGHIDADGHAADGPTEPFRLNGTYVVWRKLYEDVAAFRQWITAQACHLGMDEELLRAKLVGRWSDGSPLSLTPDRPDPAIANDPERVNAFDYADDPDGLRCPLGAHIRRSNPRTGLGFGDELSSRQRIIRRGVTYGPPLPPGEPEDGVDRGIFFVAFMADIERQFEFIQTNWCNDGDAVLVGHDPDPFIGRPLADRKFTIPGSPPKFVHPLIEAVRTRGGEYLWVPSMQSLALLASDPARTVVRTAEQHVGKRTMLRTVSPTIRPRLSSKVRTSPSERVAGTALGFALWPVAFSLAYLRGHAVVHPHGVAYDARLDVADTQMELLTGTVLRSAASYAAVVRLSRGFGLPRRSNDVHGLAIRILDAGGPGVGQDLLLATAVVNEKGAEAALRTERHETLFSSLLRLATPQGAVVVRAVSVQPMPADADVLAGHAGGLAYDITAASPGDEPRTVARLTLGSLLESDPANSLKFNVQHDGGGITTLGLLNVTRKIVYRASQRGRSLRGKDT